MSEIETLNGKDSLWYCFHANKIVPTIGKTAKEAFDRAAGRLGPEAAFSNTIVKLMRTTKEKETLMDAVLDVLRISLSENHRKDQQVQDLQNRCAELVEERRELRDEFQDLHQKLDGLMKRIGDEQQLATAARTTTLASNGQDSVVGEAQAERASHLQNGAESEVPESSIVTTE